MPQIVPALTVAATWLFTSPIGQGLLMMGASALLGMMLQEDEASEQSSTAAQGGTEFEVTRGESVAINAVFGRAAIAGQLTHHQSWGDDNEVLQVVYTLGTGLHDSINGVYVEGILRTLSGSNGDTYGYKVAGFDAGGIDRFFVKFYNGTMTQTADPSLVANSAGRWTTDHKLTGHCYVIVTMVYSEDVIGQGMPTMLFDINGLRLYDWRKDDTVDGGSGDHRWGDVSTYEFSENPAVQSFNFMRGIWLDDLLALGVGASSLDVNQDRYTAAANASDETVYYADTDRTLARYSCGTNVRDDVDSQTVLRRFEEAMGGYGTDQGGQYAPLPALQQISAMTILDDDLQIGHTREVQTRLPPSTTYTAVQGQFSDPDKGWQPSSYGIVKDDAVDLAQGGRRTLGYDALYVNRYEVARMLAEVRRRRDLYTGTETCVVRAKFVRLQVGDVVTRTTAVLGTISMMVTSFEELEDGSVRLALRQWHNNIIPTTYGFVGIPTPPGPSTGVPTRISTVSGLAVDAVSQTSDGSTKPAIRVTWNIITDPTVDRVIIRYWPVAYPDDVSYMSVEEHTGGRAMLSGVLPLSDYAVEATIATTPLRTTIYTSTLYVMTSEETIAVEIPDDSIEIDKLVLEVRNRLDIVMGNLPDRILELEAEIAQQASAGFTESATNKRRVTMLKAQVGTAMAAVIEEQIARVDADSAMALALTQVLAQVGNLFASGLIQFEARVADGGAEATIAIMVRVGDEDAFVDSGIFMKATKVGLVTTTEILLQADKLFVTDGINTADAFTFDAATGELVLKTLRFEMLKSLDGTTIVQDGASGDFSFG